MHETLYNAGEGGAGVVVVGGGKMVGSFERPVDLKFERSFHDDVSSLTEAHCEARRVRV